MKSHILLTALFIIIIMTVSCKSSKYGCYEFSERAPRHLQITHTPDC